MNDATATLNRQPEAGTVIRFRLEINSFGGELWLHSGSAAESGETIVRR